MFNNPMVQFINVSKNTNAEVAKWLNSKFLDLQHCSGRRWTVTELSLYLDCPQSLVSRWLMGKGTPGAKYVSNLARLGDDIYDVVGLPHPAGTGDPDLDIIISRWKELSEDIRRKLVDLAKRDKT